MSSRLLSVCGRSAIDFPRPCHPFRLFGQHGSTALHAVGVVAPAYALLVSPRTLAAVPSLTALLPSWRTVLRRETAGLHSVLRPAQWQTMSVPAPAVPARGSGERSSGASYQLPMPRGLRLAVQQAGKR